jgi:hypothetical protein
MIQERRGFLATVGFIALVLIGAPSPAQIGNATWSKTLAKKFVEPAWWDEGIVFVGNWEPLAFRRRHGGELPLNIDDLYRREHTEETVLKLKEAGVNMIITHFYKMGLETERDDVQEAVKLAALCHKHGMKIGAYVGGTMFAETLLREVPESKDWIRLDEHGDPIRYGEQTYRYRPDFNHPGYVKYMKNVVRAAVQDMHADLIHFDNHALIAPPWTGNTPEINRRFRDFLHRKYNSAQLKERFGFSDISAVTVPTWQGIAHPAEISPIGDPLIQEWIDFRCDDFAAYYGELADYIHSLNPDVIVELNPHGIYGTNRAFLNGIDHARLLPHGSVFWSEEQNEAKVDANGNLVSKIRSLKLARSLDQTLFIYTGTQRSDPRTRSYRLLMAEAMAFNRNCLGDVGSPLNAYDMPDEARQYIRFYHENNRHFAATREVADVALLRSFPSLAYNSIGPQLETTLMEQMLIQYKVPFQYVFDGSIGDLSRFKAVILADQESLSDAAVNALRDYVKKGGAVLATGRTSIYNDWRRRRSDFGLADVLGVHYEPPSLPVAQRNTYGTGRAAYVPAVTSVDRIPGLIGEAASPVGVIGFGNRYWKPPQNAEEILSALRWAMNTSAAVEFANAPLTTVMELVERKDGSERILHWLNYKLGTRVSASDVTMRLGSNRRAASVEILSPERRKAEAVEFRQDGETVHFRMPAMEVYELAIVRFAP